MFIDPKKKHRHFDSPWCLLCKLYRNTFAVDLTRKQKPVPPNHLPAMSVAARWLRLWPQGSQPNAPAGSVAIVAWRLSDESRRWRFWFRCVKTWRKFPKTMGLGYLPIHEWLNFNGK